MRRGRVAAAGLGMGTAGTGLALAAAQRRAMRRLRLRPDPYAGEPFGSLRGHPAPVRADDGIRLYAEIDNPDRTDVAVVFSHGWTLTQDSWHFQRRALRGKARLVFWDHRGHGRSGGGERRRYGIPQLAHDLRAVLAGTVPEGTPVILAGHSMGGMTIMRYADEHPGLLGSKIVGAALLCTSAGGLQPTSLGVPAALARVSERLMPRTLRLAGAGSPLLERVRHLGRENVLLFQDWLAFGPDTSPAALAFCEQLMAEARLEALFEFCRSMLTHDVISDCTALAGTQTLIIAAENDRITPAADSRRIAAQIPSARLHVIPTAGHMVMLDNPEPISALLADLIDRVHKPA
jgi:pimeloyl-ACP methyl ester carboxylesterase